MNKQRLKDLDVSDKTVLVRCDFNVPIKDGQITDANRIVQSIPTIDYLVDQGAKVVLMSHLGRPDGPDPKLSLEPVAKKLEEILKKDIVFLQDDQVVSQETKDQVGKLKSGQIALLENTRFRKEEAKNEDSFAEDLAALCDIFVNDAFGTSHRAHASNVGVASRVPSALGLLVEKEVEIMQGALDNPSRPFVAILGGAKVSDKIGVIENLLEKIDKLVIVGAMANTFLKAQGYHVGKSLVEDDKLDLAKQLLDDAIKKGVQVHLPIDVVVGQEVSEESYSKELDLEDIEDDQMILDIGEKTIDEIRSLLDGAQTVIWNGPAGVFEIDKFSKGTFEIGKILADLGGTTIVGGGDSAAAIEKAGLSDKITHVSTGGGASLELLEGKDLPGIASIGDRS